jgi:hypothetical protein
MPRSEGAAKGEGFPASLGWCPRPSIERTEVMTDSTELYVTITATLPVCLHLDGRTFYVSSELGPPVTIRTENFFSKEPTYAGTATNAEIESDSFSHFRFTRLIAVIPVSSPDPLAPHEILKKYGPDFLRAVNTFINAVRIALGRYGLKNYTDLQDFYGPVTATASAALDPRRSHVVAMSYGGGALSIALPNRSDAEHERIEGLLQADVPLPELLITDAKRELYYRNEVHAVLNSVIALELSLSDAIRAVGLSKGIDKASLEAMLKDVGLTGNLKSTLKLVAPNTVAVPVETVFQSCKSAITFRNNIMHDGCRKIIGVHLPKVIDDVETMVRFCEQIASFSTATQGSC